MNCCRRIRTGTLLRILAGLSSRGGPPQPLRIVEADAIKTLTQKGFVVIGGGGGIPVVRTEQGDYQSVDAVIDKDLSTALLAREIRADVLGDHHRGRKSVHPLWVSRTSRRWTR